MKYLRMPNASLEILECAALNLIISKHANLVNYAFENSNTIEELRGLKHILSQTTKKTSVEITSLITTSIAYLPTQSFDFRNGTTINQFNFVITANSSN